VVPIIPPGPVTGLYAPVLVLTGIATAEYATVITAAFDDKLLIKLMSCDVMNEESRHVV
jgi:hypothetical protein